MSLRYVQHPWLTDVFTTANATATASTNAGYTVPTGASGRVELWATARRTSDNLVGFFHVLTTFENIAGTLTLSTTQKFFGGFLGSAAINTILADFTTSGTTIQPLVTGIAATNIEWLIDARYDVN